MTGNYIGTAADGSTRLANSIGVYINNAPSNTIGGTTAGERNVISGNSNGVSITGGAATGNKVTGNYIGTTADGNTALGNGYGVFINGAPGNTIGGTTAEERNLISGNSNLGVAISGNGATGNALRGNSITANGALGIDLGEDGVTANDAGDADSGPNQLQNFPTLTSAISVGGDTVIKGTLNSTANATFTLDFYSSPLVDSSGYGEGQTYLGSTSVTTVGNDVAFSATLTGVTITEGSNITATATDSNGNTSEFSKSFKVDTTAPVSVSITRPANGATVANLSAGIGGSASDNAGGSGVRRVMVVLNRIVNGTTQYWSGSAWSTSPTYLATTLSNVGAITSEWSVPAASTPSASNLPPNTYYLRAWAYDGSNLSVYSGQKSFVIADTTAPVSVSFTTPADGSTVANLSGGITGVAQDNAGGSGIKHVSVVLTRRVNNATEYWNGSAWVATPTYLYPTLANPGAITTNWSLNQVPSGANLTNDIYTLRAYAYDKGNLYVYSGQKSFVVVTGGNAAPSDAPSSSAS